MNDPQSTAQSPGGDDPVWPDEALALLEGVGPERPARELAARVQVAFVRTLIDQIRQRQSGDASVTGLCNQLDEELARLTALVGRRGARV